MAAQARTFEDAEAKRSRVPLMLGLVGPSGGGKTLSALRLAVGIQRVSGGEIFVIDTESSRALHYAPHPSDPPGAKFKFKFRHVPFSAPFGPLDYLAAIEHCVRRGAKIVIVDSMSHEHEGPGGVLEMHAAETARRAKAWNKSEDSVQVGAWAPAKAERRRMINTILQLPIHTIFCFRAKEKTRIAAGGKPVPMGWMPIAGEEFVYEMTARCLLMPKADGIPTWDSKEPGELETMKRPEQFKAILAAKEPLSEDIGESLARWAEGGSASLFGELVAEIENADTAGLEAVVPKIEDAKKRGAVNPAEVTALKGAYARRRDALKSKPTAPTAGEVVDPETGEIRAKTSDELDAEHRARIERGEE